MAKLSLAGKDPITTAHYKGDFIDFLRSGAYVNLNNIANVFDKRLDNWMRLKGTKELIEAFECDRSYNGAKPFKTVQGGLVNRSLTCEGTSILQGTWAHPDIAIEFARWCSPAFSLWCNRQIRHLLTHGEVNLHYTEWTPLQHIQGARYNRDDIEEMYGSRR